MRLAPTCLLFWVTWDTKTDEADLDIVCEMPDSGARGEVLEAVRERCDAGTGVVARLARSKAGKGRQLLVNPRGRVVGAPDFRVFNGVA